MATDTLSDELRELLGQGDADTAEVLLLMLKLTLRIRKTHLILAGLVAGERASAAASLAGEDLEIDKLFEEIDGFIDRIAAKHGVELRARDDSN